MDALTDSVGVLLSAGAEAEHGWVLEAGWEVDPLLAWGFLELVVLDGDADAVGGEDPAAEEWLLLDVPVHLFDVLLSEGLTNGLLVSIEGGLDSNVVSWGLPAQIDLVVVRLPAGVGQTFVLWSTNVNLQASSDGFLDGWEAEDVLQALVWGLADGHTTVESEDEALWDGAVRWGVELAPGGSAGALAEELVVEDALAVLDLLSGLADDLGAIFEWVLTHVWHGTVAGDAADFDFDLHTTALGAVDAEARAGGVAGAFGDDDEVWDWHLLVLDDLVLEVVEWAAAVVVFFLDGGDGDDLDVLEAAFWDELDAHLGGHHLGDDAGQLVGGSATPDAVLVLGFLWNPAQVLLELFSVDLLGIEETLPNVQAADLRPLVWKWGNSVGVTVEVDDFLVLGLVRLVFSQPNEVAGAVDEHVFWLGDALVLDDLRLQVLESLELTVGLTRKWVGLDGVHWDSDGFLEPLDG